jgi:ferric-dicitrate binding protein FerR (iron transport regulator)
VRPRLPSVVTKKRRRSQLARATEQRRAVRRAQRMARRRRVRLVASILGILVVLLVLLAWIVTHRQDSASARGTAVDYSVDIYPSDQQATTTGGVR